MVDINKILPMALDVEKLILGYVLNRGSLDFTIDDSDFYLEAHRIVFKSVKELTEQGKSPDLVTVIEHIRNDDELERVGGISYLVGLTNGLPTFKDGLAPQYVAILREKAALRNLINSTNTAMINAYENISFDEVASKLTVSIDEQREKLTPNSGPVGMDVAVSDAYKEIEAISDARRRGVLVGIQMGFQELDRMIPAGLKNDELMLIGGRPGQGKSSLLMAIIANMCRVGKRVILFSIEMGRMRLIMKLLSMESGVPLVNLSTGFVSREQWSQLGIAAGAISQWKLWIDDSTGIEVSGIGPRIRRVKESPDLIALDYLQLLQEPKHMRRAPDNEKVGYNSKHLKWLQKSMGVPFIVCAQLNRQSDKRKSGKPQLSDIRQSGQIEQDADIIAFIYREESGDSNDVNQVATIIIGKQRNGPTGEISLAWDGSRARFSNLWSGEEGQ